MEKKSTILAFIVSKWFGVRGSKSSGSLDGTLREELLMIHSTSFRRVLKDSSSRAWPCSRNSADKMERAERICLSHNLYHPCGMLQAGSVSIE